MLVLRRKPKETIIINKTIKIVIFAVEGERVKIGIEAPPDVVVLCGELCQPSQTAPSDDGLSEAPTRP